MTVKDTLARICRKLVALGEYSRRCGLLALEELLDGAAAELGEKMESAHGSCCGLRSMDKMQKKSAL